MKRRYLKNIQCLKSIFAVILLVQASCAIVPDKPADNKKRILLCMPGDEEYAKRFIATIKAGGFPIDEVDYVLQITARINNVFPDDDIRNTLPDSQTVRQYTAETARRSLERSWSPKPFVAWFYDYEPRYRDEDGNVTESWLWPRVNGGGFSAADVQFIAEAFEGCKDVMGPAPGSVYGVPRVLGLGPPNPLHIENMLAFRETTEQYGFTQLNLYASRKLSDRTITEETVQSHIERVTKGADAMRLLTADDVPVWALMWPRWSTDNAKWFEVYTNALGDTEVNTLIIWVNPHSRVMADVYAAELIEALPSILDWYSKP